MLIRRMTAADVDAVSAVCMRSFSKTVAASLPPAGVQTFATVAAATAFLQRFQQGSIILVATDAAHITGVIELSAASHVVMFFVDPDFQLQGIGKQLLKAVLQYATAKEVTVNASLYSIPVYRKAGFECHGEVAEKAGLIYQPMVLHL